MVLPQPRYHVQVPGLQYPVAVYPIRFSFASAYDPLDRLEIDRRTFRASSTCLLAPSWKKKTSLIKPCSSRT